MSRFTKALVGAVVLLFVLIAVETVRQSQYSLAATSLGVAVFFAGINVSAWVESKYPGPWAQRGVLAERPWTQAFRLWSLPRFAGKLVVLFCLSLIVRGAAYQLWVLLR
jgi:hypothetical protein